MYDEMHNNYINSFYLENEKDEKVNPTNEETKKDGGANP